LWEAGKEGAGCDGGVAGGGGGWCEEPMAFLSWASADKAAGEEETKQTAHKRNTTTR